MDMNRLDEIIKSARAGLPDTSKTAAAIDRDASLAEISECAEDEGLHELASALFEAEQEAVSEAVESPPAAALDAQTLMREARKRIPEGSKTAAAIDRGASPEEVSECAAEEGLHELATLLFQARQERLSGES